MSSIKNLTFNSGAVQNVFFNNHSATSVIYNNITVFGGEEESAETVFELYPEFVPTDKTSTEPTIKSKNTIYTIPNYYRISGNSNFFVRANQQNTGEVTITKTNGSVIHGYKIDDYGYGIFRNTGYNNWPGGNLLGNYDCTITFTPANDTSLAKTFKIYKETDENNTHFLRGLYTSKLIRIPASGIADYWYLVYLVFPYTFNLYDISEFTWKVYDCSVVGTKDSNNQIIKTSAEATYDTAEIGSHIFLNSFNFVEDTVFQHTLKFSVGENNTGRYRYNYINAGAQIQFLQEPRSNNRIYYGTIPNLPKFWDEYNDKKDAFTNYAYIFQLANSEIVTTSKVLVGAPNSNNKTYRNVLCVPKNTYSVTTDNNSNPPIVSSSFYWGDQEYIIYQMNGNVTHTVTAL